MDFRFTKFCFIPRQCGVCGKSLVLETNRIKEYENRGYPMFCRLHTGNHPHNWMKSPEGKKIMSERMKNHNPMYDPESFKKYQQRRFKIEFYIKPKPVSACNDCSKHTKSGVCLHYRLKITDFINECQYKEETQIPKVEIPQPVQEVSLNQVIEAQIKPAVEVPVSIPSIPSIPIKPKPVKPKTTEEIFAEFEAKRQAKIAQNKLEDAKRKPDPIKKPRFGKVYRCIISGKDIICKKPKAFCKFWGDCHKKLN